MWKTGLGEKSYETCYEVRRLSVLLGPYDLCRSVAVLLVKYSGEIQVFLFTWLVQSLSKELKLTQQLLVKSVIYYD